MPNRKKPFTNGEMTVLEAAKRLNITLQYVYTLLWQRQLAGRKDGRRWIISADSVRARLKQQHGRR